MFLGMKCTGCPRNGPQPSCVFLRSSTSDHCRGRSGNDDPMGQVICSEPRTGRSNRIGQASRTRRKKQKKKHQKTRFIGYLLNFLGKRGRPTKTGTCTCLCVCDRSRKMLNLARPFLSLTWVFSCTPTTSI